MIDAPLYVAKYKDFKAFIAPELTAVDAVIQKHLTSEVDLVNQIGRYIVTAGGKRIRPLLVILIAKALNYRGTQCYDLAAVVEFIHTATLLHDDVVDESLLRRGRKTSNALFGNSASVLVGDFLYSRAFQMMVSVQRMRVLEVLANATNTIAQGEVLQLVNMRDPDLSVADYYRVIEYKTAQLFEASTRLGAILADATPAVEKACADYGVALGTAFQLVDDLLDYAGNSADMGKNAGDDLREGKVTLPLLIAMQRASEPEKALIRTLVQRGSSLADMEQHLAQVLTIIERTDAINLTRLAAQEQVSKAQECLQQLPPSDYRAALADIAAQSITRVA